MQKKNNFYAFTLLEILVVMVIIGIALLGVSRLNFARLTKEQFIEIEVEKIRNIVSEVQANAFLGKSVNSSDDVPEKWRITFSSGSLLTHYSLDGTIWTPSDSYSWSGIKNITIQTLECMDINHSNNSTMSTPQQIEIKGGSQTLIGCPSSGSVNFRILQLEIGEGNLQKSIFINTTTGTVESN